jgi:Ulp1 protease family, C-terminal catalytic domain
MVLGLFTSRKRVAVDNIPSLDPKRPKVGWSGEILKKWAYDFTGNLYTAVVRKGTSFLMVCQDYVPAFLRFRVSCSSAENAANLMLRELSKAELDLIFNAELLADDARVNTSLYFTVRSLRLLSKPQTTTQSFEPFYLNDEIIDGYLKLLKIRDKKLSEEDPSRTRSFFFSPYFLDLWYDKTSRAYTYDPVRKYDRGRNLFELDKVFFPICLDEHWVLVVAYMKEKRIGLYDSLNRTQPHQAKQMEAVLVHIMEYFTKYHLDKFGKSISGWRSFDLSDSTPKQENGKSSLIPFFPFLFSPVCWLTFPSTTISGYDCGVFVCMCADFISMGFQDNLSLLGQIHATKCRSLISLSILKGEPLLYPMHT